MNVVSGSGFVLGPVVLGGIRLVELSWYFLSPRQCLCKKALQEDMLY